MNLTPSERDPVQEERRLRKPRKNASVIETKHEVARKADAFDVLAPWKQCIENMNKSVQKLQEGPFAYLCHALQQGKKDGGRNRLTDPRASHRPMFASLSNASSKKKEEMQDKAVLPTKDRAKQAMVSMEDMDFDDGGESLLSSGKQRDENSSSAELGTTKPATGVSKDPPIDESKIDGKEMSKNGKGRETGREIQEQHEKGAVIFTDKIESGKGKLFRKQNANPSNRKEKNKDRESKETLETAEERILISEIDVAGCDGKLRYEVLRALTTRPNFAYTIKEVQEDMQRVFDTGYFSSCRPRAEDTRDGVRLTVEVTPNPQLRGVVATGASCLPQKIIQDAFAEMAGRTLNYNSLTSAVGRLNAWYEENGVLGQVTGVELGTGDVAQVKLAEATVDRISLKYVDPRTGEARDEGKTVPEVILRQLTTRPGRVYNLRQAKRDIEAVYSMGLFDDVSIRPSPSERSTVEDPHVDLTLEVKERKKTGGLSAGGGISAASGGSEGSLPGFVGTISYSQRNLFGRGQRLMAAAEIGQADSTFRLAHTDPWIKGDEYRTSRSMSAQNTKTSISPIHGRVLDEQLPSDDIESPGDGVYVSRTIAGVEYGRPLGTGWQGSLGISWQMARCIDDSGRPLLHDCYRGPLMVNRGGNERDIMSLGTIRVTYNNPSGDSELVTSMEQAVPLRPDWLNFNRFTVRADKAVPVGPIRIRVSAKGGAIVGDLPPYEAFPIGGTNSVRGFAEGGLGTGRNFAAGTCEIHFPLVNPLQGCLFADYGSDLGSGTTVPGDPAGVRQKPGAGYGYGAGVRIDTPIGPLRLEYAFNHLKDGKFHVGIGNHG